MECTICGDWTVDEDHTISGIYNFCKDCLRKAKLHNDLIAQAREIEMYNRDMDRLRLLYADRIMARVTGSIDKAMSEEYKEDVDKKVYHLLKHNIVPSQKRIASWAETFAVECLMFFIKNEAIKQRDVYYYELRQYFGIRPKYIKEYRKYNTVKKARGGKLLFSKSDVEQMLKMQLHERSMAFL